MPYFHPSTVVVIDGDSGFLDSVRSQFRGNLLCRTFTDPEDALRHIRKVTPRQARHSGCIVPGDIVSADGDQTVMFRPSVIRDLVHDASRFQDVSVVVIDGDRPDQQGLEVCRRLREVPARRIMVGGESDGTRAIAAFNDRLIDRFLVKNQPDAIDRLGDMCRDLQLEYFARVGIELGSIIGLNESGFLVDPDFLDYFAGVFAREGFVEYFLSENPPGLLLVRGDGAVQTLLVQHYAALAVYSVSVREQPPGMTERMAADDCQPWFPTKFGFYSNEYHESWHNHLYPARRIGPWYCSVINGIPGRKLRRPAPSYQDYRRRLYQDEA